jgi:hypothetical protein
MATGKEVRDLGYVAWKDPLAWMETMKGKRWENLIQQEKTHYNKLIDQPRIKKTAIQMEKEIRGAHQYLAREHFTIGGGTIHIFMLPSDRFIWKWSWLKGKEGIHASDIDVHGNIVWYITSDEDKHYKNRLICEDSMGKRIWTKPAVSSQIAIVGDLCYYVKVVNYYQTVELCVCDAQTGNMERVLYREKDEERDLVLCKTANKTLYLKSEDPSRSDLYRIKGLTLTRVFKNSLFQLPLGESIYGEDCVLIRNSMQDHWEGHGKPLAQWHLPKEEIQWCDLSSGHLLTIHEGAQTIWQCVERKKAKPLYHLRVGSVDPNQWTTWENALIQSFHIKCPFEPPFMIHMINNTLMRNMKLSPVKQPITFDALDVRRLHAVSNAADKVKVPYIVVKQKGVTPKAQLIYAYGAYGATTPVEWPYQNWYPLLKRGWAIVFAMIRGGGDVNAAWANAARRDHRTLGIDDYEAVIRDARYKLKLPANRTVLFGRSAGGVPVGVMVSRFPHGELMGAVFTEVPYLDVLRTSSNPDLPLTVGEYKEFGNPAKKILNFKEMLEISPMNTLPTEGAPGVFVITRVGLLDKQVYAYESFKWIQRLRGNTTPDHTSDHKLDHTSTQLDPKGKYITYERHEGHQYRIERIPRFRAEDLAILEAWVNVG